MIAYTLRAVAFLILWALVFFLFATALTGCGGGGSYPPDQSLPPPDIPASAPYPYYAPASQPPVPCCRGG